jgi:hypothetical protein
MIGMLSLLLEGIYLEKGNVVASAALGRSIYNFLVLRDCSSA